MTCTVFCANFADNVAVAKNFGIGIRVHSKLLKRLSGLQPDLMSARPDPPPPQRVKSNLEIGALPLAGLIPGGGPTTYKQILAAKQARAAQQAQEDELAREGSAVSQPQVIS
eukprot:g11519.t1